MTDQSRIPLPGGYILWKHNGGDYFIGPRGWKSIFRANTPDVAELQAFAQAMNSGTEVVRGLVEALRAYTSYEELNHFAVCAAESEGLTAPSKYSQAKSSLAAGEAYLAATPKENKG